MVFSFSIGGWVFCFLSSSEEGAVFVISLRGGRGGVVLLPWRGGSRWMFDMVV